MLLYGTVTLLNALNHTEAFPLLIWPVASPYAISGSALVLQVMRGRKLAVLNPPAAVISISSTTLIPQVSQPRNWWHMQHA